MQYVTCNMSSGIFFITRAGAVVRSGGCAGSVALRYGTDKAGNGKQVRFGGDRAETTVEAAVLVGLPAFSPRGGVVVGLAVFYADAQYRIVHAAAAGHVDVVQVVSQLYDGYPAQSQNSPNNSTKNALYYGAAQMIVAADGLSIQGMGVGFGKDMEIKGTVWKLEHIGQHAPNAHGA